jgi:hypothetical protein
MARENKTATRKKKQLLLNITVHHHKHSSYICFKELTHITKGRKKLFRNEERKKFSKDKPLSNK